MKWTHWMVVVTAASMLVLGGCKGKASTPKELLEKVHEASQKKDVSALADCIEPDAQKLMKDVLGPAEDMQKAIKEAAEAVEKKLGAEEAKPLHSMAGNGENDSPLKRAVQDGKIDWSKINIKEEGDKATVEINGKKADVELKKVDGNWYLAMPAGERPKPEDVQKQAEHMKKAVDGMKQFTKDVNDGKVTKDNYMEAFGKAMSAS